MADGEEAAATWTEDRRAFASDNGGGSESGELVAVARRTTLVLGNRRQTVSPSPTDDNASLPTENTASLSTDDTTGVPTENTTGVPTENTTGVPTENTTGVPTDGTTGVPTENTASLPTDDNSSVPRDVGASVAEAATQIDSGGSEEAALRARIGELEDEFAKFQASAYELLATAKRRIEDLFIDRQEVVCSARRQAAAYRQQMCAQLEAASGERDQLRAQLVEQSDNSRALAVQVASLQEQLHSITKESSIKQGLMEQSCERISTMLEPLALARLVLGSLSVASLGQAALTGYLIKQGAVRKNWKKRYHVLIHNFLLYYRTSADVEPLGALYLIHPSVEHLPHTNQSRPNTVRITSNGRTYNFCCETREDAEKWVERLESASSWYLSGAE